MGQFFFFLEQIVPSPAAHARTYAARIFADVAQRKWRPKFPKSFMILAHNPTRLWLLEFYLSNVAVSCSSLSEDSVEFRYVPFYIADQELNITPI